MLKVNEIFHSIQGEGINMGRFAVFVRLTGCNLVNEGRACSWCDTKYAFTEGTEMSSEQLTWEILKTDPHTRFIVFTGGEPMLQGEGIVRFLDECPLTAPGTDIRIAIETNGTIAPGCLGEYRLSHAAVSPKIQQYDLDVLFLWTNLYCVSDCTVAFKFVVDKREDLDEIYKIVEKLHLLDLTAPTILQPNGFKQYDVALDELVRWVREYPKLTPYVRILPQLHRVIWKGERGK